MSARYGRAQFLKDAARLGLTPDVAFSHVELRRRRDRLMIVHHPDHGGDGRKAARINAIYGRMMAWLDARSTRMAEMKQPRTTQATQTGGGRSTLSERLNVGAARVWGLAAVAAATYVALRRRRKV